jgi:hypothetical protein
MCSRFSGKLISKFEMSFKLPELPYDKAAFGKTISV